MSAPLDIANTDDSWRFSALKSAAKILAREAGMTLEARQMSRRPGCFMFGLAPGLDRKHLLMRFRSYDGKLMDDVRRAIAQENELALKRAEKKNVDREASEKRELERLRIAEKFHARFGALYQLQIGALNVAIESIEEGKVSLYCQRDISWDDLETLVKKLDDGRNFPGPADGDCDPQ